MDEFESRRVVEEFKTAALADKSATGKRYIVVQLESKIGTYDFSRSVLPARFSSSYEYEIANCGPIRKNIYPRYFLVFDELENLKHLHISESRAEEIAKKNSQRSVSTTFLLELLIEADGQPRSIVPRQGYGGWSTGQAPVLEEHARLVGAKLFLKEAAWRAEPKYTLLSVIDRAQLQREILKSRRYSIQDEIEKVNRSLEGPRARYAEMVQQERARELEARKIRYSAASPARKAEAFAFGSDIENISTNILIANATDLTGNPQVSRLVQIARVEEKTLYLSWPTENLTVKLFEAQSLSAGDWIVVKGTIRRAQSSAGKFLAFMSPSPNGIHRCEQAACAEALVNEAYHDRLQSIGSSWPITLEQAVVRKLKQNYRRDYKTLQELQNKLVALENEGDAK